MVVAARAAATLKVVMAQVVMAEAARLAMMVAALIAEAVQKDVKF